MFALPSSSFEVRCEASVCKKDEYSIFVDELGQREIRKKGKLEMPPRTSSPVITDEEMHGQTFSDSLDEFFYQMWKNRLESPKEDQRTPQCHCPGMTLGEIQNYLQELINRNRNQNQHRYCYNRYPPRRRQNFNPPRANQWQRNNVNLATRDFQENQPVNPSPAPLSSGETSSPTYYPYFDPYGSSLIYYYPVGYRSDGTYGPVPHEYYCSRM